MMAETWSEAAGGLRLGASITGDVLTFVLQNVGDRPLRVLSAVDDDLDWYSVRLDGRVLAFVTDRDESAVDIADLAPGGSVSHAVDLADWSGRPLNGGAVPGPGAYPIDCLYEVDPGTAAAFGDGDLWTGSLRTPPLTWRRPG
jgi:hypothetical protein